MESIENLIYHALFLVLLLSAPPIGLSMIIGFIVAVMQAATQINEQTIGSTLKLVIVIGILILLGPWFGAQLLEFMNRVFSTIALIV